MAHVTVCTANLQCERFPGDLIGPVYYEQTLTTEPLRYQADRSGVGSTGACRKHFDSPLNASAVNFQ